MRTTLVLLSAILLTGLALPADAAIRAKVRVEAKVVSIQARRAMATVRFSGTFRLTGEIRGVGRVNLRGKRLESGRFRLSGGGARLVFSGVASEGDRRARHRNRPGSLFLSPRTLTRGQRFNTSATLQFAGESQEGTGI